MLAHQYSNIPINLKEWQSTKTTSAKQLCAFITEKTSQWALEMTEQELLKNFKTESKKAFREIKQSINCKAKQATNHLIQSNFNPSKYFF